MTRRGSKWRRSPMASTGARCSPGGDEKKPQASAAVFDQVTKKNRRQACGFFIATPKLLLGVGSRGSGGSSSRGVSLGIASRGSSRSRGFSSRGRGRGGFRGFLLAASGQGQGSDSGSDQGLFHIEFLSLDLVNDEFRASDPVSIQLEAGTEVASRGEKYSPNLRRENYRAALGCPPR